ncbi:GNAT family N-acetyltransferase [Paludibacter sp.]|uniref:GNAT family N-acetyltransferase n=1 Tax=Paludibacter sp. TaxID=1898105 RepID=UPI001355D8FA|nr:GNAT family N-acetyltransferase [Paludibacter sp.]MTK52535.1 GNAT family N-acetyltransferase [Paludibacter sp.]
MVVFDRVVSCEHPHWHFLVSCYLEAFPADERRPLPHLEALLQRSDFWCNVLQKADEPVGLFLSWQLPGFRYIEHFAIAHAFRGQIIGKTALNKYLRMNNLPVVLEVEPPVCEINSRRIRFYEREDFVLCEQPFIQPPYASGQNSVELRLMEWGGDLLKQNFEQVKNELYRTVYDCDNI